MISPNNADISRHWHWALWENAKKKEKQELLQRESGRDDMNRGTQGLECGEMLLSSLRAKNSRSLLSPPGTVPECLLVCCRKKLWAFATFLHLCLMLLSHPPRSDCHKVLRAALLRISVIPLLRSPLTSSSTPWIFRNDIKWKMTVNKLAPRVTCS